MSAPQSNWFHDVASALAYSLALPHETPPELASPHNDLTQFILTQHAQMPDYLRTTMKLAALGFDAFGVARGGKRFHCQSPERRAGHIAAWKNSSISFQRDFIRYFESLATLALYSSKERRTPGWSSRFSVSPNKLKLELQQELRAEIVAWIARLQ